MKLEDKVAWSKGMLMLPQHMQQLDRYHEARTNARVTAMDGQAWGVIQVTFDRDALREADAQVVLKSLEGVMPDGTPVTLGPGSGSNQPPAPVGIGARDMPSNGAPLSVYLCLPRERPRVDNYGVMEPDPSARFIARRRERYDSASNDQRTEILLAEPNFKLQVAADSSRLGDHDFLQIGQIVQTTTGLAFGDSYIPPCINIHAAPHLVERVEALRGRVVARQRSLSAKRREAADGRVEFHSVDVTRFLQLHALNTMLPSLYHLTHTRDVSPRLAFLTLTQLCGQLATFSIDADMTEPLDYDFEQLGPCFARVLDLAEELLQVTDRELYLTCPFQRRDGMFYADLRNERLRGGFGRYVLAVRCSLGPDHVRREIEQNAKIAPERLIESTKMGAFGGIPACAIRDDETEPSRMLPPQIERKRDWVYFNIPQGNEGTRSDDWKRLWEAAWKRGNVCLWLPGQVPADMEIKLLSVLESQVEE